MIARTDHPKFQWDRYRAFHYSLGPITVFDTGELMITACRMEPGYRHHYRDHDITLATTTDKHMPSVWAPDGTPIAKTALNDTGAQVLLIDETSNRAVRLDSSGFYLGAGSVVHGIPERLRRHAYGYIGGPGCLPIGMSKVKVRYPHKVSLSEHEITHIDGLRCALRAMLTIQESDLLNRTYSNRGAIDVEKLLKESGVNGLPTAWHSLLLNNQVTRRVTSYDYVLTKEPT